MDNPISVIINTIVAGLLVLAGYGISFLQQKWTQKQTMKNALLKDRLKVYGKGLGFIYEVEQSQTNAEELERINKRFKKWFPSNVVYLPPSVNDAFFKAMNWTVLIIVDLHNKDENEETWKEFKEKLQKAKTSLMDLKDIGWLPKDLK